MNPRRPSMRIITVALLVLCSLATFSAAAHAKKAKVVREPRPIIRVPMVRTTFERVDPHGPPVVPVIRYGNQEMYLLPWTWPEMWISPRPASAPR
jgi:hypothetical protein